MTGAGYTEKTQGEGSAETAGQDARRQTLAHGLHRDVAPVGGAVAYGLGNRPRYLPGPKP